MGRFKVVGYNFSERTCGEHKSAEQLREIHRDRLRQLKQDYRHTGGSNKSGSMRHVASIPLETYMVAKVNDPERMRDPKEIKRLSEEGGFTVGKW